MGNPKLKNQVDEALDRIADKIMERHGVHPDDDHWSNDLYEDDPEEDYYASLY